MVMESVSRSVFLKVTTQVVKWLKTRFGLMNISSSWEISPRLTQGFVRNTFWYLKSCWVHISLSYINHFPWGVTCNTLNVLTLSKSLSLMADGIAVFKIFFRPDYFVKTWSWHLVWGLHMDVYILYNQTYNSMSNFS